MKTLGEINWCKKQQAYTQEWDFVTKQITFIAYISLSKKKKLTYHTCIYPRKSFTKKEIKREKKKTNNNTI